MLKVSAFYIAKQKVFFLNKYFLNRCQYQNKRALFTDPFFSEGFGLDHLQNQTVVTKVVELIVFYFINNKSYVTDFISTGS